MVLVIEDTQEKKEVVFRPRESRATARNPSFAPNGSRVVFSLSDIGGHQIVSVNFAGRGAEISDEGVWYECLAGCIRRMVARLPSVRAGAAISRSM